MFKKTELYIDGKWRAPLIGKTIAVANPATELPFAVISLGSVEVVNRVVAAARRASPEWSQREVEDRMHLLARLCETYKKRSTEMGTPITLATNAPAPVGLHHIKSFPRALTEFQWKHMMDGCVAREKITHAPIGVCHLITHWNWPMKQMAMKVMPTLGVGCTIVHKQSEFALLSSILLAEMIHDAGFPPGGCNLVNGDGSMVGRALSTPPDVNMISFTGSTDTGTSTQQSAASTGKRIVLELGGKSSDIVLVGANLEAAIQRAVAHYFQNTGQPCNVPTKMLIECPPYEGGKEHRARFASEGEEGTPETSEYRIGPLASKIQFDKIQALIAKGTDEGARLIAGGLSKPDGFDRGYYVQPTIFADANNRMTIAHEVMFGPVLCMMPSTSKTRPFNSPMKVRTGLRPISRQQIRLAPRESRESCALAWFNLMGSQMLMACPLGGYKQSANGARGRYLGPSGFPRGKSHKRLECSYKLLPLPSVGCSPKSSLGEQIP